MALIPVRGDTNRAPISKVYTVFSTAISLHEPQATAATSPATGIKHLPSTIFVLAAAADVLEYVDALGNTNSITFVRAFDGELPFIFASIGTNTTVDAVVVAWHPEP